MPDMTLQELLEHERAMHARDLTSLEAEIQTLQDELVDLKNNELAELEAARFELEELRGVVADLRRRRRSVA